MRVATIRGIAMPTVPGGHFDELLHRAQQGDAGARDETVVAIHHDLRALAHRRMARERPGHTLQVTALVHEALGKMLSDATLLDATGRELLYHAAPRAMEQILVEHHRHRAARKGPGQRQRVLLDEVLDHLADETRIPLIELQEVLEGLERVDTLAALIVRLYIFMGLSQIEVVEQPSISQKTVERDWRVARGWLHARPGKGESAWTRR
ncbi:ECF-type sigma factor [Paludisphaera mucosa]|uniref:ECF-type sigma factor n=1 Tax=Paludisphaera mucosa TaxID=3030827 RepID=A0ABT6FL45_9BACT|nr:ECF-type sigma factor [Paludisphaera mucosa]MDG3008298.1 ECF-type sigma factor [Paludisphaera mucosa]